MFTILIVDDEHLLLNGCSFMIRETLELPFPVKILTALNVPEAIAILEKETPDLILTDIRMPVMDGFVLIEHIRKQQLSGDIVILTSHADFEYARTAIRYHVSDFILKPIDEKALKSAILKSRERTQQKRLEALHSYYLKLQTMLLYEISASDLLLTDEILTELFPYTYFTVLVVTCEKLPESAKACEDLLLQYYKGCHAYLLQERRQLVFVCNHQEFFVKPANLSEKLYQTLGTPFLCGVSISSNSVHKLHSLYANACQRIFYQKVFGSDEQLTGTASFSYQDCISVFVENEESKMRKQLFQYTERLKLVEQPSRLYLEQICVSFFQNINLYLENQGIPKQFGSLCSLPDEVRSFEQLSEYILAEIMKKKTEMKELWSEEENDALLPQLLSFIKEHCREDISLDDLSSATGFHPNYICTFFKKATGQSYLACLHRERIRAAKELLEDAAYTIEEISHQVGYNSSTQFARIFRKYEGISPSDYRNL